MKLRNSSDNYEYHLTSILQQMRCETNWNYHYYHDCLFSNLYTS